MIHNKDITIMNLYAPNSVAAIYHKVETVRDTQ